MENEYRLNSIQIGAVLQDIVVNATSLDEIIDDERPYRRESLLAILYGVRSITKLLPDVTSVTDASTKADLAIKRVAEV